jgi:hypothetical protein
MAVAEIRREIESATTLDEVLGILKKNARLLCRIRATSRGH